MHKFKIQFTGEKTVHLHADNCSGQNKNNTMALGATLGSLSRFLLLAVLSRLVLRAAEEALQEDCSWETSLRSKEISSAVIDSHQYPTVKKIRG